jgi:acyl-CoA reductase-like NAD-dependent aldehyde dehydrogenase
MIVREPIGVIAAVVPWNFPLLLACWKLGPALAAGNSVILKPSEKSPLTALRLAGLAKEAGLPDGVLNVVSGFGHEAGQALALHPDVEVITFTGSTRTGKQLLKDAGDSNMKRVWLEAGGKSANIVFADCPDLQKRSAPPPAASSTTRARCVSPVPACCWRRASPTSFWHAEKRGATLAAGQPARPEHHHGHAD